MPTHDSTPLASYVAPAQFKDQLHRLQRTDLLRTLALLLLQYGTILVTSCVLIWGWSFLPIAVVGILHIVGLWLIARAMRGLELLVHDGSHFNWVRGSKTLNDGLTNALAAYPMMMKVDSYREAHLLHHQHLGNEKDPELCRFKELGLDEIPRSSATGFIAAGVVPFFRSWKRDLVASVSNRGSLVPFLAIHAVLVCAMSTLLGLSAAVATWLLYWAGPLFLLLPLVRFLAEGSEHRYSVGDSMLDNTVSHYGGFAQWLIYPFGDGYHFIHHRFASIPTHNLRTAHLILSKVDPDIYGARHLHRSTVFQEPIVGA